MNYKCCCFQGNDVKTRGAMFSEKSAMNGLLTDYKCHGCDARRQKDYHQHIHWDMMNGAESRVTQDLTSRNPADLQRSPLKRSSKYDETSNGCQGIGWEQEVPMCNDLGLKKNLANKIRVSGSF